MKRPRNKYLDKKIETPSIERSGKYIRRLI